MQDDILEIRFFHADTLSQLQEFMNDFITHSSGVWKTDGALAVMGGQYVHTLIRVRPQENND